MALRFSMIGLFVEDVARMVAFYRDVLGAEIEWDGKEPYAEFRHEGIRVSMYERKKLPELLGKTPDYPKGFNGTFELAIDLPAFPDVDEEFQRVVAAGGRPVYPPRIEPWGMRSSMIADPEGNLIEIGSWNSGADELGFRYRELCPQCGEVQNLRLTRSTEAEPFSDGTVTYTSESIYHCAVCGVFVRSEKKAVSAKI